MPFMNGNEVSEVRHRLQARQQMISIKSTKPHPFTSHFFGLCAARQQPSVRYSTDEHHIRAPLVYFKLLKGRDSN